MDDDQLLRYSRHILLPQIGIDGQQRLLRSRVLIVGMGGLGSPAAIYLAASGLGHLVLVDHDKVDLTNLQRQIAHNTDALGDDKVDSAKRTLLALNPETRITTINMRLEDDNLAGQIELADAVVDASDNFATRFAVNRLCVEKKTPLISGAVVQLEGQVTVFRPDRNDSPCYRCLYKETGEPEMRCAEFGVLAPVAGIIGSIQATEIIKVLLDLGETLTGRLMIVDAYTMEIRTTKLTRDPACPVCG
ncbi:MAG: molybdopterin-synthase adenylyltransferase MoeB [Acidiferrobacterales bacterium]